jgi:hypothetical protein
MRRLLPAHVLAIAAMVGLASCNAVRLVVPTPGVLASALAGTALLAAAPSSARLGIAALLVALAGVWWGSVRLDMLDRSPLRAEVARAGRAVIVITGEPRVGRFAQRLPGRVRGLDGRSLDERVQLDLPLGRAPPQGAIVSALVVVRLPRKAERGFDERRWLRRQGVHVVLQVDE